MINKRILFASLVGVILAAGPLWAAEYFCDYASGANTNAGTRVAPWKEPPGTVSPTGSTSGWVTITAGDIVYLKGGESFLKEWYVNSSNFGNGSSGNYISLRSGHLASPVWGTTARAVIDGQRTRTFGIFVTGRTYIKIEGFEIKNQYKSSGGPNGPSAIESESSANYLWVVDNITHDVTCGDVNGGYGIEINHSTNVLIEKNITYNNQEKGIEIYGSPSSAANAIIRLNVVYNNGEHGIVISGTSAQVYRNLLWHNAATEDGSGANIKCDTGPSAIIHNNVIYDGNGWNIQILNGSTNVKIYNNTLYNGFYTSAGGNYGTNMQIYTDNGADIQNNILYFYNHGHNSMWDQLVFRSPPGSPTYILKNNIFYGSTGSQQVIYWGNTGYTVAGFQAAYAWATGNIQLDPGFLGGTGASVGNLPTGFNTDWTLNNTGLNTGVSSAGTDHGLTLGSPYDIDINGNARTGTWDIGAYEYGPFLFPPKMLRVIQ